MAIALDATGQSGQATDFQTSFSFTHTLGAGSNRIVLVGIYGRQGGTGFNPAVPTYGGVNMTSVQEQGWNVTSGWASGLWVIKDASISTGSNTVAWTASSSDGKSYGVVAASFTGVDQTTPTENATGANNTDATPTITVTSATGNLVIALFGVDGDPATVTFTMDGTEIIRNTVVSPDQHSRAIMESKPGGASVTCTPTVANNPSTWFASGVSLKAASGGGGTTPVMWLH